MGKQRTAGRMCAVLAALAVVAGGACVPDPPNPPSEPALPVAPRMELPAPIPDGTRALVHHFGADDDPLRGGYYLVDADSAEELDEADLLSGEVVARAIGGVASDGRALIGDQQRPGTTGLLMCESYSSDECRAVPGSGRPWIYNFSPDESLFAVAVDDEGDRTVRVHDAESLELIVEAPIDMAGVMVEIPWNPDSTHIAISLRDGPSPYSLATLEATTGAEPTIVVPYVWTVESLFAPVSWTADDQLIYQWWSRTSGTPEVTTRSVPADGSGSPTVIAESHTSDRVVGLPDGSVLHTPWATGVDRVVHHAVAGEARAPLSRPERWNDGATARTSETYVIALLEPGEL